MRNRTWRKWRQEIVYKKRLKKSSRRSYTYYKFTANNGIKILNPNWSDLIGSDNFYLYKSISTHKNDSAYKIKYSPNKTNNHYRDLKINRESLGTRELDKLQLMQLKNEYGI